MTGENILLINPAQNYPIQSEMYPSGALILIGTMLYNLGHNVKIVHMVTDKIGPLGLRHIVLSFKPDTVGITMSTFQTESTKEISKIVKRVNSNILVVVGGPHPSAVKLKIFDDFPNVDVVVVGEGEHTFLEIVGGKDLSEIKGICYNHKMNPLRPLAESLDYIPLPNLALVDINKFQGAYPLGPRPNMFIMASRGCPFHCTFCNKSVFGHSTRLRRPKAVIEEIKWLRERWGIKEIFFQDDTFNLNRGWAEEILSLIIDNGLNKDIIYRAPFRANEKLLDEKLLQLAKKAGFWLIFYGVENGNQQMLDGMKKALTTGEIKRAFELTHRVGLKTEASFIIGMPSETKETIMDSMNLWKEIKPYWCGFARAIPFPDTEFERVIIEKNHLLVSNYDEYRPDRIIVRTDSLAKEDLEYYAEMAEKLVLKENLRKIMVNPVSILRAIRGTFASPKGVIRGVNHLWKALLRSS